MDTITELPEEGKDANDPPRDETATAGETDPLSNPGNSNLDVTDPFRVTFAHLDVSEEESSSLRFQRTDNESRRNIILSCVLYFAYFAVVSCFCAFVQFKCALQQDLTRIYIHKHGEK